MWDGWLEGRKAVGRPALRAGRHRREETQAYIIAPPEPLDYFYLARAKFFLLLSSLLLFLRSKSIHGDATTVTSFYLQCRVASFSLRRILRRTKLSSIRKSLTLLPCGCEMPMTGNIRTNLKIDDHGGYTKKKAVGGARCARLK